MTLLDPDTVNGLAREVIDRLDPGMAVRLATCSFTSSPPLGSGDFQIEGSLTLGVKRPRPSDDDAELCALEAWSRYRIEARSDDESQPGGWTCELEYRGLWGVAGAGHLSEDHLRAFAAKVVLMALHPYARAHVQNTVTSSGWPPYVLDVLTTRTDLFAAEDDPEMVDLSDIAVT